MHLFAKYILILQIIILFVTTCQTLLCIPCHKVTCKDPEDCKGGLVRSICGCCNVCAKVKGEDCGGQLDLRGICDQGLKCVYPPFHSFRVDVFGVCQVSD
ncbi:hypothetical protein AALO_G00121860 [Alosa alosa]|uniref:IGFBP N-terminal domain-containing protein n=1 Tax=Alosa alosa TaxID=278164 RepID=A0AAV6GPW8_9TELE|nr:hypothetical protein AALO_G00121860 [Alosa alosa]